MYIRLKDGTTSKSFSDRADIFFQEIFFQKRSSILAVKLVRFENWAWQSRHIQLLIKITLMKWIMPSSWNVNEHWFDCSDAYLHNMKYHVCIWHNKLATAVTYLTDQDLQLLPLIKRCLLRDAAEQTSCNIRHNRPPTNDCLAKGEEQLKRFPEPRPRTL